MSADFRVICCALGVLAAAACSSANDRSLPPAELSESLNRHRLANGLEVVVVPRASVPLVTALVAFRSGAFVETPEQSGYSHLLEHMMFKGSAAVPEETEYRKRLRALGIETNAFTEVDVVAYFGEIPRDNLDAGLELLSGALRAPLLSADSLADEIKVVLAEFDLDDSNPDDVQQRRVAELLFPKYPNRKNVIGNRDVIAAATPDRLRELYDTYYVPNNALLVLSGDIDAARGLALAKKYFGDWKRGANPFAAHPVPEHPALKDGAVDVKPTMRNDSSLEVAWQGPDLRRDPRATMAATLLAAITTQNMQWFRSVVGGAVIGAGMSFERATHTGMVSAGLTISPGGEANAIYQLRQVLAKLPESITDEQVEVAKDKLWTTDAEAADSSTNVAFRIAGDWAFSGLDFYEGYLDAIYDVSRADVVDMLERYVSDQPAVAVLFGPSDLDTRTLSSSLEGDW